MLFKKPTIQPTLNIIKSVMPTIFITSDALAKMSLYIGGCTDEIGWFGFVRDLGKRQYIIDDVILFEQQVHSTTTEITEAMLSRFAEELLTFDNGVDLWNGLKMWGHSHVNMGVSPSGQDDSQMEFFSKSQHDFFIRIIGNKSGDMRLDFYDYINGVSYNNLAYTEYVDESITVYQEEAKALLAQAKVIQDKIDNYAKDLVASYKPIIDGQIKTKVKKISYMNQNTNRSGGTIINNNGTWNHRNGTRYEHFDLSDEGDYLTNSLTQSKEEKKNTERTLEEKEKFAVERRFNTTMLIEYYFSDFEISLLLEAKNFQEFAKDLDDIMIGNMILGNTPLTWNQKLEIYNTMRANYIGGLS